MANHLYKYISPAYLQRVLSARDKVTVKCSLPKEFNDPYELFLTIDFNEKPEVLAFYEEAVGQLPQLATTCFSRSPAITPMWAHYAQNLEGVAIEFDEEALAEAFPKSGFGDVDYRDSPDPGLTDTLYRAYGIGKPRYVYFLHTGVFSAAYYTKATCWSYELERRMVAHESEIRREGGSMLLDAPSSAITALIVGPRASAETKRFTIEYAERVGCAYLEMKIGRSTPAPYFLNSDAQPFVFNGQSIERAKHNCHSCKEPLFSDAEHCSWCLIEESHKQQAARRNPYRLFAHYGMLDSYIESMEAIRKSHSKK